MTISPKVKTLLKKYQGIRLDLGGGFDPQEGFINMDYRDLKEVDIVHDVELFPWPLPDECAYVVMARHLLEHLNPHEPDARQTKLMQLLIKKGLLTEEEVLASVGEISPGPIFMRFMDEVWRILKPKGQFMIVVPYAGSQGWWQDPTHTNPINQWTWQYFDPTDEYEQNKERTLWDLYKPKPWKIEKSYWNQFGNMEVLLSKREAK